MPVPCRHFRIEVRKYHPPYRLNSHLRQKRVDPLSPPLDVESEKVDPLSTFSDSTSEIADGVSPPLTRKSEKYRYATDSARIQARR